MCRLAPLRLATGPQPPPLCPCVQGTAAQSEGLDWSCATENDAILAAGLVCPPFVDTSCSAILAQPSQGSKIAPYLASLLADLAYEPSGGTTWEERARSKLAVLGATDVQFVSKTRIDQARSNVADVAHVQVQCIMCMHALCAHELLCNLCPNLSS